MVSAKQKINFTHTTLKKLPLPSEGKRGVYFDTKVHGLNVIITDKGKKSFYVRRVIKGESKRIRLGPFPDLTVENARGMAENINSAIAKGEDPHKANQEAKSEPTFGEFFETYMRRHAKVHKKTASYDQSQYDNYLASKLGKKKLSAITQEDIRELHIATGDHGYYAANRMLALVRAVFNKATEWGVYRKENPAAYIKPFKEKSRERFLQKDELPCFFEALNEEFNQDIRDFVWLCILTGARRSNILAMQWQDIHLKEAVWQIPETKNGESQLVPLVPAAIKILERRYHSDTIHVFPSHGKTGHMVEPKSGWKRIRVSATLKLWQLNKRLANLIEKMQKKLPEHASKQQLFDAVTLEAQKQDINLPVGLVDLRLHDLRRTMGSYQASLGTSLNIIGKSLGHKDLSTTQIYDRLNLDPVREAMNKAAELMLMHQNMDKKD